MRIRRKKWASTELSGSGIFISEPLQHSNDWDAVFSESHPISLELGCGKGLFIAQYASTNLEVNFIAIDIKTDMLAVSHRNICTAYSKVGLEPSNIVLVPYDITRIENLFSITHFVDEIFINFPNPWDKPRHQKRRLTHPRQLIQYSRLLKDNGVIHFKTDDKSLYCDTLEYLKQSNYNIILKTEDYYSSVGTKERLPAGEHEMMYSSRGIAVLYIKAGRKLTETHIQD